MGSKNLSSKELSDARRKAADEAANVRYFAPGDFLAFEQDGAFMLTIPDDRSYIKFTAHLTFPLTHPDKYISLRSGNDEIGMIRDLSEFDKDTKRIINKLLKRRYYVPKVLKIVDANERYSGMIWQLETDRGPRTIITKSLHEAISENSSGRYFLTDVDGNRYEIQMDDSSSEIAAWFENRI